MDGENNRIYDLNERTLNFALRVRKFVKTLKMSVANIEDSKQLVRASGSVGANYREANEALSKKDFAMRIKICRKEAKESEYWLTLVDTDENKMPYEPIMIEDIQITEVSDNFAF